MILYYYSMINIQYRGRKCSPNFHFASNRGPLNFWKGKQKWKKTKYSFYHWTWIFVMTGNKQSEYMMNYFWFSTFWGMHDKIMTPILGEHGLNKYVCITKYVLNHGLVYSWKNKKNWMHKYLITLTGIVKL